MLDTVCTGVTRSAPCTLSRTAWQRSIISAKSVSTDPVRPLTTRWWRTQPTLVSSCAIGMYQNQPSGKM